MVRRLPAVIGVVAVGAASLFLFTRPAEVEANQFNPAVEALRRELAETKQQLAAAQQQLVTQSDHLRESRRRVAVLTEELRLEQKEDRGEAGTVRRLRQQLLGIQATKYAHYSVWKRKPFVPAEAANHFMDDVFAMLAPQTVPRGVWVGTTSVPDVAGGDMTLLLLFDDREAHKKYTEDPTTRKFYDKQGRRWDMVKALDVVAK